jgi:methylated-DNA-[protein]-cysteine S-methyltransferase
VLSFLNEQQFRDIRHAIGACGIVWNARGVAGVQIHDGTEAATRSRLLRRFAGAQEAKPPAHVQQAIDGVVALCAERNVT